MIILYEGPFPAYSIITKFGEIEGKDVTPGLVYSFPQLLEEKGLLKNEIEHIEKVYDLNEEGRDITNVSLLLSEWSSS